jgi:hypothetical protein
MYAPEQSTLSFFPKQSKAYGKRGQERLGWLLGSLNYTRPVFPLAIKKEDVKPQTSISTTIYSKAYLAKVWQDRSQLSEYERRGFAQFFYFTICGHLEALLAAYINARLGTALISIKWDNLGPMRFIDQGVEKLCSLDPVTTSIKSILARLRDDVEVAPLGKLTELYSTVFSKTIRETIGPELNDDLLALTSIRNLFAHGRNFSLEFKEPILDFAMPPEITLESHPLKAASERLRKASLIKDIEYNAMNHDELRSAFYCDGALLYFYEKVNEIEKMLVASQNFEPERFHLYLPALPVLK